MKWCAGCSQQLPTELFYKNRSTPDGLTYACKACHNARTKSSRNKSPDYKAKESVRAMERAKRNPDKTKEYHAKFRKKHAEKRNEISREWSAKNRDRKNERDRIWRKNNPASAAAQRFRRRAREALASGVAENVQISGRIAMFAGRCWICNGIGAHIDHVKPLARGGSNWPSNFRPICLPCNSSKGPQWPGVNGLAALADAIRGRKVRVAARIGAGGDTGGSE